MPSNKKARGKERKAAKEASAKRATLEENFLNLMMAQKNSCEAEEVTDQTINEQQQQQQQHRNNVYWGGGDSSTNLRMISRLKTLGRRH